MACSGLRTESGQELTSKNLVPLTRSACLTDTSQSSFWRLRGPMLPARGLVAHPEEYIFSYDSNV